jgi:outer membrane receptor protein involved in Fe transport
MKTNHKYRVQKYGAMASMAILAAAASTACAYAAEPTADTAETVDTIIVTAQKRSERLLDVPVPVTALSAAKLLAQDNVSLKDIYTQVPGLNFTSVGNGRGFTAIRGITTGGGNNPTVAFTVDDSPISSSVGSGLGDDTPPEINPADLQGIEVLRGPQGTLYGAASLGGLIKYVTKAPSTTDYSGNIAVSGNTVAHGDEGYGLRASVNIPVIPDVLGVRLSGFTRRDAGFLDDPGQGKKDTNSIRSNGMRASVLWNITPNVDLTVQAAYNTRMASGAGDMDVLIDHTPVYGKYQHERIPGASTGDFDLQTYSAKLNAHMDGMVLTSVTSYTRSSFDGPQDVSKVFSHYIPAFTAWGIDNYGETNKFAQEVRLASDKESKLDWTGGLFFTRELSKNNQGIYIADPDTGANISNDVFGAGPYAIIADVDAFYMEYAGFADATYHFTDKFQVQVGGRYSASRQRSSEFDGGPMQGGDSITALASKDHAFTYLFSPQYKLNDNAMIYGRIASGYRPGGPNATLGAATVPASYDPDHTVNYEVGFKGQMLDNRLMLDVSAFNIDWTDIQVSLLDPATARSYTGNGGKAYSRGIELSSTWTPIDRLTFSGNFAYTDAAMAENVGANVASVYFKDGDRLPFSAKYAGSLSVDKIFTVLGLPSYAGATVNYVGEREGLFVRSSSYTRYEMPSYTTLDLRAGVTFPNDIKASIYVKNATDKLAYVSGTPRDTVTGTGVFSAGVITPRLIGFTLEKSF